MEEIEAVEMVRRIRDDQYEATKDLSSEELKTYFNKEARLANEEAFSLIEELHMQPTRPPNGRIQADHLK